MASTFGTTDPYAQGKSNVDSANSTGQSNINSFDPNAWQSSTQSGLNNITSQQSAGNQSLVDQFKQQIASQPSATQALATGQQMYNVQPLQNTANQLNNAVLQAPIQDVNAAKGFNYDANQIGQKQTQDLAYLTPQANAAQNNATTAQNNALAYQSAQLSQNATNLIPLQTAQTQQAQLYAQQYSGFTATSQAQLASLQDKMDQGVSLSASEMTAYATLTTQESAYQQSLATANAGVQEAQIGQQYQKLTPGESLYGVQNGQPAQQLATNAPTIGSGGTVNYGAGGGYYPPSNTTNPPASAYQFSGQPNNNIA